MLNTSILVLNSSIIVLTTSRSSADYARHLPGSSSSSSLLSSLELSDIKVYEPEMQALITQAGTLDFTGGDVVQGLLAHKKPRPLGTLQ